jgi:hypothetical protein
MIAETLQERVFFAGGEFDQGLQELTKGLVAFQNNN